MKLSFIIPVYNAASFLDVCVQSVIDFPWSDREILLIDDGSTDGSEKLCDAWVQKSLSGKVLADIKCVHQTNQGVSAARNVGLAFANGDWIWMVDADDRVLKPQEPTMALIAELKEFESKYGFLLTGFVWEEHAAAHDCGASPHDDPYNLWRCWFRKSLIDRYKLRFKPGRKYAEDQEFIICYRLAMEKSHNTAVFVLPQPLYYYTLREGSAMTKPGVRHKMMCDIAAVISEVSWQMLSCGACFKLWAWRELKRMTKNFIVVMMS